MPTVSPLPLRVRVSGPLPKLVGPVKPVYWLTELAQSSNYSPDYRAHAGLNH